METGQHFGCPARVLVISVLTASGLVVKSTQEEQAAWIAQDPATYAAAWASGCFGWIDVVLARTRHDEIAELITQAWRLTAPARLSQLLG